ncbi:hypothetical protein Ddye_009159 [Dipteronia dyeriana]|uniref:BZIP domain-containing protein n=1 Tax=Dipteronia dyeriana TaxID=168575 RepID=A0AAD9XB78_9ROSI|nr:hypothetical protein Ddye_009159 [Dipteronia dyeriana]
MKMGCCGGERFNPECSIESFNRGPNPVPEASQMETEKLMKRMKSNREASRRSRLRKKQHVEQLERSIRFAEMDLAMISPLIIYYQNCNKRLEIENNEMRKRLVAADRIGQGLRGW